MWRSGAARELGKLLVAILLIRYPLRGRTLQKMLADVLGLHAAKHAMLTAQEAR